MIQALPAAPHIGNLHFCLFQQTAEDPSVDAVVIHQKDLALRGGKARPISMFSCRLFGALLKASDRLLIHNPLTQIKEKSGTFPIDTLHPQIGIHQP